MKKKRVISWILFILWMLVIFFFSHQHGGDSTNLSNGVLEILEKMFQISFTNNWWILFIRKLAHFSEYAILGILIIHLISQYQKLKLEKKYLFKILLCVLFCFLYASSDEFHQLFVTGRSGQFRDVLIDTCGSITGIFSFLLIYNRSEQ